MPVKSKTRKWLLPTEFRFFFARPSLKHYQDLHKACEEADCWIEVHGPIMKYLEEGVSPDLTAKKKGWPLPSPEAKIAKDRFRPDSPEYGVLIDVAIHEKRLEDVVTLYRQQKSKSRWHNSRDEEIARAVAIGHPDIALGIWHKQY